MKKNFYNSSKEKGITIVTLVIMIILIILISSISIFNISVNFNTVNTIDDSTSSTVNKVNTKVKNLIDNQKTLDNQDRIVTINLYTVDSNNATSPIFATDDVVLTFYLDKEETVKEFDANVLKNSTSAEVKVDSLSKGIYYVSGDFDKYKLINNEITISSYDYKVNVDLFYKVNP